MGGYFRHLRILHWNLHFDWSDGCGLDNKFPRMLFGFDGAWNCIADCEYLISFMSLIGLVNGGLECLMSASAEKNR